MDEIEKHIDELVTTRIRKQAELIQIGQKIASLATPIVVAFVDLTDSTQMKQNCEPEEWLGFIFDFIQRVDHRAIESDGTLIKRIGDELMITFKEVLAAERFVNSLISDMVLQTFRYKIAIDYGSAYHLRFKDHLADDPYGQVVDRCARIAKYAATGTVICTFEYLNQLDDPANYVPMGAFSLRGFPKPIEIFARSIVNVESENYLKPLVNMVNEISQRDQGYRFVSREFTPEFLRSYGEGWVRPFIARELLNVPKLPYSPKQFQEILLSANNREEKESEFLGYFVEWEGKVSKFELLDYYILLTFHINEDSLSYEYKTLFLVLPFTYLEIVKALGKGQRLRVRGIIWEILLSIITLNYVDFEITEKTAELDKPFESTEGNSGTIVSKSPVA
jgi:class 3 adenylate cyclase